MDESSKQVLVALSELAIDKNSKKINITREGLLLRSLFFQKETELLENTLNNLKKDNSISNWSLDGSSILTIEISSNQDIPLPKQSEKNMIKDKVIRRSLIHRLYEEYIKENDNLARFPLAQLADILEVTKEEIFRHVIYLKNEYYLKYEVMDGGMCTSNLTHEGIKLYEDRERLLREFGAVQIQEKEEKNMLKKLAANPKKVFVVHGRNEVARNAMFDFLRSIGLEPIEWTEAIATTKTGSPYIGEILDNAFRIAQAVIVMITGDDIVKLQPQFQKEYDPENEKNFTPQARPNVLFEAGLAFGRHPDNTIMVELGSNKPFSDIAGRHIIKINNSVEAKNNLISRLKKAGCEVDIENKSDWIRVGDFESALVKAKEQKIERPSELFTEKKLSLNDLEIKILKALGVGKYSSEDLSYNSMLPEIKIQYTLDSLLKKKLVRDLLAIGQPIEYMLTEQGRAYLIENNLI